MLKLTAEDHGRLWAVAGQTAFERIYVLNALEPGLEAYEIYPGCVPCS